MIFVMSVLRVLLVRLKETPKYLIAQGRDANAIASLRYLARKHGRECDLTVNKLTTCGEVKPAHTKKRYILQELGQHISGLFVTKKLALSTSMVWASWILIRLAYPLFYVFLPAVIANRLLNKEDPDFITWRNYTLTDVSGIPGLLIASVLCNIKVLDRKYTIVISALLTMVFFFGYTVVSTKSQNIACCINIYYGTLYAYTAEIFPSAHRATGSRIAVALNRVMGMISAVIAAEAGTDTVAPVYVCAVLFLLIAVVSACSPFEPYGRWSS